MGIKDFISATLEKNREKKEQFKEMQAEERNREKLESKKKSPMERELEKYQKIEHDKKIEREVLRFREKKKYESEMKNAPINQKSIFKEKSNLFNAPNTFIQKGFMPKPTKPIFTSNVRRSK